MRERLVAIGASAGGVQALLRLIGALPQDFSAPIIVAVHLSPGMPSSLPTVLGRATPMRTAFASEGMRLSPGTITIAPPGAHIMVEAGWMPPSAGPREHGERPSIDP